MSGQRLNQPGADRGKPEAERESADTSAFLLVRVGRRASLPLPSMLRPPTWDEKGDASPSRVTFVTIWVRDLCVPGALAYHGIERTARCYRAWSGSRSS